MIKDDLMLIDEVIFIVKAKDDSLSYFDKKILYRFELSLFLCLDIKI
jgi:hypothetical protein